MAPPSTLVLHLHDRLLGQRRPAHLDLAPRHPIDDGSVHSNDPDIKKRDTIPSSATASQLDAVIPASSTSSPASVTPQLNTPVTSHPSTPKYVPALAAVFSILGVGLLVGLAIFAWRWRRNRLARQRHEEVRHAKWTHKWRARGYADSGERRGQSATSSETFLTAVHSPEVPPKPPFASSPGSPPAHWSPFHLTPYRVSFTIKVPSQFRTAKQNHRKSSIIGQKKELVLPSLPRPSYDKRSPPPVPSRPPYTRRSPSAPSTYSRPSLKSQSPSPPPAYVSRSQTSSTVARSVGSKHSFGSKHPDSALPPIPLQPRIIDVRPLPLSPEPAPYQPIPSPVPTPTSQIVTVPPVTENLPLPRSMVVVSTFTPALSDELRIQVGQALRMVEEYDDGWCLVERLEGYREQGAVPRFCLDEVQQHENTPQTSGSSFSGSVATFSSGPFPSPTRTQSLRKRHPRRLVVDISAKSTLNRI